MLLTAKKTFHFSSLAHIITTLPRKESEEHIFVLNDLLLWPANPMQQFLNERLLTSFLQRATFLQIRNFFHDFFSVR